MQTPRAAEGVSRAAGTTATPGSMRVGANPTVQLAGAVQTCPCHACAFFRSREEEHAVLLPFMAEGIAAGDKCVNIIDERNRDARRASLASVGIDVAAAERSGQLELRAWEEAHILGGHFDQHGMLARLEESASTDRNGFRLTRLWSNQEWVLEKPPGVEDLIEYEARFNYIWPKYDDITVCVYDASKFGAALLVEVLRAHPFAILSGVMVANPFYVPPDEMLRELKERRPR